MQRTGYLGGLPPLRGTNLERWRFETRAHRASLILEANADRWAFVFPRQRPAARAAAACPFLRVGFFFFIDFEILKTGAAEYYYMAVSEPFGNPKLYCARRSHVRFARESRREF